MDQTPLVPPTFPLESQASEQPSDTTTNTINSGPIEVDANAPALLEVETTHVEAVQNKASLPQGQQLMEPTKSNTEEMASVKEATPAADTNHSATSSIPVVQDLEPISNLDVTELTTQIMDMINEDDEGTMTQTNLLKKNVELQEFMVKLIELLREKTNLSANLERQNTALTNQARSLRDVIAITKDLLNIRNMEVEHLHVDMAVMEKSIKEERDRHNMAVERLSQAMSLNDKLKTEYLAQMEMFGKLRDKYNEKIVLLNKEIRRLRDLVKEEDSAHEPAVPTTQDIIQPNVVASEQTNGVL